MHAENSPCTVRSVLFDYGGVLAEEGFLNGLRAVAAKHGADPEAFWQTAVEIIYETGYPVGQATEKEFFALLRERTGVEEPDAGFRDEILPRFRLQPRMMAVVDALAVAGVTVAVLSDQTEWLDALDAAQGFGGHFDAVFNSYYTGVSKRDPRAFVQALEKLDLRPEHALFVDDAARNVAMAREVGLHAIHYEDQDRFERELREYCPALEIPSP